MPSKIRNNDWERLFGPNAPRRGGPLRAFITMLVLILLVGGLTVGTMFLLSYRDQQEQAARAEATVLAATFYPLATQTITARTATAAALAERAQPTAVAGFGLGVVGQGGNLRREPVLDDATILGLIWPGDQVSLLEQRDVNGQLWYRVQVLQTAPNRGGEGVAAGTEGWASSVLISPTQ